MKQSTVARACVVGLGLLGASDLLAADETIAWDQPRGIWLNAGLRSRHFDQDKHFRENNTGFGVEVVYSDSGAAVAGEFRNSDNLVSRYGGWVWKPVQIGQARVGLVAALFDGYPRVNDSGWFPAVFPVLSLEYRAVGVNLILIPTVGDRLHGALAAQFKLRVW